MSDEAHILLLEDDIYDAELVKFALDQSGFSYSLERVGSCKEFKQRLLVPTAPDLILADYHLPDFDGLTALEITRDILPDTPFIFVTGTLGEELAIETLKRGATDYVLKTRLSHLVPAIHRALREAGVRTENKLAEERLRESREQLRALSVYLRYVREEERTRISREVHDELGQSLTGLKIDLAWLATHLSSDEATLYERVTGMTKSIDETIKTIRRIATELRPGILDDLGLVAALEWQTNEFENRTGIACEFHSQLDELVLDSEVTTAFFRIFQEALTNIMLHANASQVNVRFNLVRRSLVLYVQDNGRGITISEIHDTRSIGLLGMKERASLLGGKVTFDGSPGMGTTVNIIIPRTPRRPGKKGKNENPNRRRPRSGTSRTQTHSG